VQVAHAVALADLHALTHGRAPTPAHQQPHAGLPAG
jgi:hypothetical protein